MRIIQDRHRLAQILSNDFLHFHGKGTGRPNERTLLDAVRKYNGIRTAPVPARTKQLAWQDTRHS